MKKLSRYLALPFLAAIIFSVTMMISDACKKTPIKQNIIPELNGTPQADVVTIQNSAFDPAYLSVARNSVVTWENNDDASHSVSSSTGLFESGELKSGMAFRYKFTTPGTYTYLCRFHSGMTGTIVVE